MSPYDKSCLDDGVTDVEEIWSHAPSKKRACDESIDFPLIPLP